MTETPDMPPEIATIVRMRSLDYTEAQIAAELGWSRRRVSDRASDWNARRPEARILPAASRRKTPMYARVADMRREGKSYADIAQALGLSRSSVSRAVSRARELGYLETEKAPPATAREAYANFRRKGAAPPLGNLGELLAELAPEHARVLLDRMQSNETVLAQTIGRILRAYLDRA